MQIKSVMVYVCTPSRRATLKVRDDRLMLMGVWSDQNTYTVLGGGQIGHNYFGKLTMSTNTERILTLSPNTWASPNPSTCTESTRTFTLCCKSTMYCTIMWLGE